MYARTGKLTAQPGKRSVLADILLRASALTSTMRGCKAYVVFEDLTDGNSITVFELWEHKDDHSASLRDERVHMLISEAMPILASTSPGMEMQYLGGHGFDTKSQ